MIKFTTIVSLSLSLLSTSALASEKSAFGLAQGEPVPAHLVVQEVGERTFKLKSVPAPYPDIDVYAARTNEQGNICSVTGYIPLADQDKVEGQIASIYLRMSEAYGDAENARPGGDINEAWLWFTEDKKQTVTLRRFLGQGFKRAATLEFFAVGGGCK